MASRKDKGGSDKPPEVQVDSIEIQDVVPTDGVSTKADKGSNKRRAFRDGPRARTIPPSKRLSEKEIREGVLLAPLMDYQVPKTRGECQDGPRPCPFVRCRYHLYLDVNPHSGSIKLNFPHLEVWELKESCALDVADRGGVTREEVGEIMNRTGVRVQQIEVNGLFKLKLATVHELGFEKSANPARKRSLAGEPASVEDRSNNPGHAISIPSRNSCGYSIYQTEEFRRKAKAWPNERERRIALMVCGGMSVQGVAVMVDRTRQAIYLVLQKIKRWGGRATEEIAS